MPSKNLIREFYPDSYYHVYNRGVEKRLIFMDDQDYAVFISYLRTYLEPKDDTALQLIIQDVDVPWKEKKNATKLLRLNNFYGEITLMAYCLMPNHFHLLLHQRSKTSIDTFMNSMFTRYPMYFNRRYKRVGRLFQDEYKAVRVTSDEQLLHLSRYIHQNPKSILQGVPLERYKYSSYPNYIGESNDSWILTDEIHSYFKKNIAADSYKKFVETNYAGEEIFAAMFPQD